MDGLAFALGVLVALTVSANASAGAAANPARQNPISLSRTVVIGNGPAGLAYDGQTHTLYSVNQNSNSVSVVATKSCHAGDTKGCTQHVGTVALGSGALPEGVALDTSTDTLYVANAGSDTVSVINATTCSASNLTGCAQTPPTVADPEGPGTGIAVNPLTDTIYVANAGSPYPSTAGHTVSVIDGATCNATATSGCGQIPPTVTVGYQPVSVAVDQGNNTVYVANPGIANTANTVSVIDGATCDATTTLGCSQDPGVGHGRYGTLLDHARRKHPYRVHRELRKCIGVGH